MESAVQASGSTESEALQQMATRYAAKLAAGSSAAVLVDELVSSSGCSRRDAEAFMATLTLTGVRPDLPPETLNWTAAFARRASAEAAKRVMVRSSRFLLVGAVGVGALVLWNPKGLAPDVRQLLQFLVLGFGVPVIIGMLGIMAGAVTWMQHRGTAWPAPLADKPSVQQEIVHTTRPGNSGA